MPEPLPLSKKTTSVPVLGCVRDTNGAGLEPRNYEEMEYDLIDKHVKRNHSEVGS